MICPVCHIELSKAKLRSHLFTDHSTLELQITLQAESTLNSSTVTNRPTGFTPEAEELFLQLNNARRLHNQNLLSQRKALSTLSKTFASVSPWKDATSNVGTNQKFQRIQNGSHVLSSSRAEGKFVVPLEESAGVSATTCSCKLHRQDIDRLETSLKEKKEQIAELTLKLKKEMEKLEDREMVISDLNTFLKEAAEKQSIARAKLEGYMDNLITRTVMAEEKAESLRSSLAYPISSRSHSRDSSSDPVKATGTPLREQKKQRRSPSVDLMKTLNQIKQRDKNRRPRASSTEETSSSPLSFRNSPLHVHTSENGETYPRGPAGSRGHPFTMAMESVQTHRAKLSHRSERKESISNLSRMNSLRGSASAHLERLMYQQELFRKEEDTNMGSFRTPRSEMTHSFSTEDTSTISVSSLSDLTSENETTGHCYLSDIPISQRLFILRNILAFLDIQSKLNCSLVCKEWKNLVRQPSLWHHLDLDNRRISSKFLKTVSSWCSELRVLKLSRIKPSSRRMPGEAKEAYQKRTRGCLDDGLESVLASSQNNLAVVKISGCKQILSRRSFVKLGQHCPNLRSLKLDDFAIKSEVMRSLSKGCKQLTSLQIVPETKREGSQNLTNSTLDFIGCTWYQLQAISIGGKNFTRSGLLSIVKNCPLLQILELSRAQKVNEDAAKKMCRTGLRELHTMLFTNTMVTPRAILHFYVSCPQLKSIRVYVHRSDVYLGRGKTNQTRSKIGNSIADLQRLKEHPGLGAMLQIWTDLD